jgi:integrase
MAKRFVATARIKGEKKYFYGKDQEEADNKRNEAKNPAPDFQEFFKLGQLGYFAYKVYGPRKRQGLRNTSKNKANGILRLHILPVLGHKETAAIGYDEFTELYQSIRRRNKKGEPIGELSAKGKREIMLIAREVMSLYAALEEAKGKQVRKDWRLVKLPKVPRKKKRAEAESGFMDRLLAYVKGHWTEGPIYSASVLMLRRGEICGLKWSAIDRERLRVTIDEQSHPLLPPGAPTKGDTRSIPITAGILAEIDALGDHGSIYVFTMPAVKGGKRRVPLMPDEVSKTVPEMITAAGLGRKTLHDLRAFGASNLAKRGTDLVTIMELLGHAKLDTTMIYLDGAEDAKRTALGTAHLGRQTAT